MDNQKHGILKMSLNSITQTEDPTLAKGVFVVHDFDVSGNYQQIPQELCEEYMSTLISKPIVLRYIPREENYGMDGLTDHEDTTIINRDGEEISYQNTIGIGSIDSVWIDDGIKSNGESGKVLYCSAQLWLEKYSDILGLLQEWLENDIKISCSVEYLYCNYEVINGGVPNRRNGGYEVIKAPIIYTGLCILNSEQRALLPKVNPSYESSFLVSLNKLDELLEDELKINLNQESGEDMRFVKNLNDLSMSQVRKQIYALLESSMSTEEYGNTWIEEYFVFDGYVIIETYYENDGWKYFKVPFAKTGDEITSIDLENKVEVQPVELWVQVPEVNAMQTSLNEANAKVEEMQESLNEANAKIEEMQTSLNESEIKAEEMQTSLNAKVDEVNTMIESKTSDSEMIASLNAKIEEMQESLNEANAKVEELAPYKQAHDDEQFKASLNAKIEEVSGLLAKVGGSMTEEIEELCKQSLNAKEEDAKMIEYSIQSAIVNCVKSMNATTSESVDKTVLSEIPHFAMSKNSIEEENDGKFVFQM